LKYLRIVHLFIIIITLALLGCEYSDNIVNPISLNEDKNLSLSKEAGTKRQSDDYLSVDAAKLKIDDLDGPDQYLGWKRETHIYVRPYVNSVGKDEEHVADNVLPAQHCDFPDQNVYDGPKNSGSIENIKFKITEVCVSYVWNSFEWKWIQTGAYTNVFWTEEIDLYNPGNYLLDVISEDYFGISVYLRHGDE